MPRIEKDMGISIRIICVNIYAGVRNVQEGTNVRIPIHEWSSCISIKLIRKNSVHIFQPILINANMENIVHLHTVRMKSGSNLSITISLMRISICFIIKPSSVLSILPNMIRHFVSMHIIFKIIEGILHYTIMNQFHAIIGS